MNAYPALPNTIPKPLNNICLVVIFAQHVRPQIVIPCPVLLQTDRSVDYIDMQTDHLCEAVVVDMSLD